MKNLLIGLVILIALITIFGVVIASSTSSQYENISAANLDTFMDENKDYQYIDVRTAQEFEEGYVEGFKNIEDTKILAGDFSLEKDTPVVLLCRSGNRSTNVAKYLASQGYEVTNVSDGIINYKGELK